MRNIILCGFMGSGKTTVGRQLADLTGRRFIDTDLLITEKAGMTIPEIFKNHSEQYFRELEREVCARAAAQRRVIIAAGGGALTFPENVNVFADSGDIVLLDVPVEVILKRLTGDISRPLLARPDREEAARELYNRRLPAYRTAASYIINAEGDAHTVALRILSALGINTV